VTDRRRLVVMRHAKAESFGSTDQDRSLTDRGVAAAADAGRRLRDQGLVPEVALVSTAARALETWTAARDAAGFAGTELRLDPTLFNAGFERALETLQALPEDAGTVMLVGHNPTASYLCHFLDDGAGDPDAVSGLLQGFPPGAFAVLEVPVPWTDLGAETCRVVGFHVGRG